MDKNIYVYRIRTEDLPKATKAMNGRWDCFSARVIEIEMRKEISLVAVELRGSYPFIQNKWKFILSEYND